MGARIGRRILIEPHGPVTDSIDGMEEILDGLKHEEIVGVNLDTGNSWLGGSEPVDFVRTFESKRHAKRLEVAY